MTAINVLERDLVQGAFFARNAEFLLIYSNGVGVSQLQTRLLN